MHTFKISPKEHKIRLDHYLTARFPQWSRSHLKRLIDDGFVLVNGAHPKAGYPLKGGDDLQVLSRAPEIPKAVAQDIPLNILYEDDHLLVLNKPAGLVMHPAAGNWQGTLVNALLHHLGTFTSGEALRPGIVHRLDKGTSGVVVVSKRDPIHQSLSGQFKHRKVKKIYHALVFRSFQSLAGVMEKPIGRDRKHRLKFSSQASKIREATTYFKVMKNFPDLALLELTPHTGRTHQLRVHLSEAKHPIVGDDLYGARGYLPTIHDETVRERAANMARPALHAYQLSFTHPVTAEFLTFQAPWPDDFRQLVVPLFKDGEIPLTL